MSARRPFEARRSDTHGAGVFATAQIPSGAYIITFGGPLWHLSEFDMAVHHHLQVGPEHYLGPSGDLDDLVNHSCEPNAGFHGGLDLVARRDIAPGEEITMDYGAVIDEADFPGMTCLCGAARCRGAIRSFRHLDADTRAALRPWVLPYLRAYFGDNPVAAEP